MSQIRYFDAIELEVQRANDSRRPTLMRGEYDMETSSIESNDLATSDYRRCRPSGHAAWDALLGGFCPGLTVVYAPKGVAARMVYPAVRSAASADEWSSDILVVGVGIHSRRPVLELGSTSVATSAMRVATLSDFGASLTAFRGGVVVIDDLSMFALQCELTRPTRAVKAEFMELMLRAQDEGTSLVMIGSLDLAGRPVGGGLVFELARSTLFLRSVSGTVLGEFATRVDMVGGGDADLAVRGDVPRSVRIDRSGVTLVEPSPQNVVKVEMI